MSFDSKRKVEFEDTVPAPAAVEQHPDLITVDKFSELMKKELLANMKRKGGREGWLGMEPMDHLLQVYYHVGKLQAALKALEVVMSDEHPSGSEAAYREGQVREFAADVANHALMLLDRLNILGVPHPEMLKVHETDLADLISEIQGNVETVRREDRNNYNDDDTGY
jgi:hypothetical protein